MTNNQSNAPAANGRTSQSRRAFLCGLGAVAVVGATSSRVLADEQNSLRTQFLDIQAHENAHVATLRQILGSAARPLPTFQNLEQATFVNFLAVSQTLENTGVGAYLGATPVIFSRDVLAGAGSIALIEARHAGFLNDVVDSPVTAGIRNQMLGQNFESPLTAAEVRAGAGPFIQNLNGGPPVDYSTDPAAIGMQNDLAILNFALALEYLEAAFYNINVPKFYPAPGQRRGPLRPIGGR